MSKLKELKGNIKEKGKRVLNWIEENPGKSDFLVFSAYLVGLTGIVWKYHKDLEKRDIESYRNHRADYRKFLEECLRKTFEEKDINTDMLDGDIL